MFAKLKEKIQKEGGGVSDGDKSLPSSGASPRRLSFNTAAGPGTPVRWDRLPTESDAGIGSGDEAFAKGDASSKEEVLSMLLKRTEHCKKLEAKISEYAAVIKEKNKSVEKLELYVEKQQNAASSKTQELNDQNHSQKTALDSYKEKLEEREKERDELLERLKVSETARETVLKKEVEKDAIQSQASLELDQTKQLLKLAQKELTEKTEKVETLEKQVKDVHNLQKTIDDLQSQKVKLEEESRGHMNLVSSLTKEKLAFEHRLEQVNTDLTEKLSNITAIQSKYTELEDTHQALIRNSDVQKNKLNQLLQERADHISQLQERIQTLEQRGIDQNLSGDDRVEAMEKERDTLERKLTETREQLSQIKLSWSEKISHLEGQISHLNGKIVEDNEEMASCQKNADTMRENLHKEIELLRAKLKDVEKQSLENWELAKSNGIQHEKEKHRLEKEIAELKEERIDLETQLRAKITSLESQILSTENAKTHEKSLLIEKITHYKSLEKESIEKEIKAERKIEGLEQINIALQNEVASRQQLCKDLQKQLQDKNTLISKLEADLKTAEEKLKETLKKMKSDSAELSECCTERDSLMLRNAELSQQLMQLQRTMQEDKQSLAEEIKSRTEAENLLRQQCDQLQQKQEQYEQQLQEANQINSEKQSESEVILQNTVSDLEEQLLEKNKALKKQEQRLSDLKKTLQRELKVQSLPNDEHVMPALTPPRTRKHSGSKNSSTPDVTHSAMMKTKHHQNSMDKVFESGHLPGDKGNVLNFHGGAGPFSDRNTPSLFDRGQISYEQFLPYGDSHTTQHTNSSSHGRGSGATREWDSRHLEKDVNFQYLKHVVMKFMLSRESEAVHLIKAISLLLRLNPDEQKLMRDTLEWKMSWFGGSQPPAVLRGQTSKIIPPSL